jgi:hypothetical protein
VSLNCPNCGSSQIAGRKQCECGYNHETATTGRPNLSETTTLPPARRTTGVTAMLLGVLMLGGGGYLAREAYMADAPRNDMRYLIGVCTLGAGLLCFRRGWDRSSD